MAKTGLGVFPDPGVTLRLEFDVQYRSFPLSQNEGMDMNWTTNVGGEEISISIGQYEQEN